MLISKENCKHNSHAVGCTRNLINQRPCPKMAGQGNLTHPHSISSFLVKALLCACANWRSASTCKILSTSICSPCSIYTISPYMFELASLCECLSQAVFPSATFTLSCQFQILSVDILVYSEIWVKRGFRYTFKC